MLIFIVIVLVTALKVENFFDDDHHEMLKREDNLPFFHPFETETHLQNEADNDPLGFSTGSYLYSKNEYIQNLKNGVNGEETLYSLKKEDVVFDESTGKNTSIVYNSLHFPGTFDLDREENIIDLICSESNVLEIITSDLELLKVLIPGTRVHFGFDWEKCPGEYVNRYNMVLRRKKFVNMKGLYRMKFEMEPLAFNEMYHSLSLEFSHEKVAEPVESHVSRRQSIDTRESFMFFGFNYDQDSQRCINPSIELYSDSYNKVTCENCYAYLDSGIILKVETSWLKIQNFKIGVYGKTEANFGLKYQFSYSFSKTWDFKIFEYKFPTIKFMVGYIPIYIAPAIELSVTSSISIKANAVVTSSFSFADYAEYTLNYDGDDIYSESKVDSPDWDYQLPTIDESSTKGTLNAEVTALPKVLLYIYSVAPVQLTGKPKLYFDGEIDTHKMDYSTSYSLDVNLGLDPLVIPDNIPEIGGKTYDFGGKLPWGKTWEIYSKTPLQCEYCSGEVDF